MRIDKILEAAERADVRAVSYRASWHRSWLLSQLDDLASPLWASVGIRGMRSGVIFRFR